MSVSEKRAGAPNESGSGQCKGCVAAFCGGWLALFLALACQPPLAAAPPPPAEGARAPTAPIHYVGRVTTGVSASESALEDRLGTIKARLEALGVGVMDFWKKHGLDPKYGGIYGMHDRQGEPKRDADKGLIQQARHLWSFSTWYARREKTPEIKATADSIYKFLVEHFRDEDGEFFYKVSYDGKTVVDRKKQLYAESFAILGLVTYAEVFESREAGQQALACFKSIDARTHDAQYLGYDQTNDPGWLQPGAQKDTNTHIHLLESFTELYRWSKDETVKARLDEMVKVIATLIVQPSNYAHKEFYRDWRVHDKPIVSYGHDIETSWLLMDSLEALGKPMEPVVSKVALQLGKNSADFGYDSGKGGYFEEGIPGGAPNKLEKIWWIQAEALPGLWWLYRLSNDAIYLDRLEGTLSFIESSQVDKLYGEWFWGILPDGSVGPHGDQKGEEWKAQYHALRAVLFTADWIEAALTQAPATSPARVASPPAASGG